MITLRSGILPKGLAGGGLVLLLVCGMMAVSACPIPVYQYALEHWQAESYILDVYLPPTPTTDEAAAWQRLQDLQSKPGQGINLLVRRSATALTADADCGWLVLQYPERARRQAPVWQGVLSLEQVERIVDSPFRQRLGQALAKRTSVVWILLQSGRRNADTRVAAQVQENLDQLAASIVIPEKADWGGQTMNLDYEVNFQLMTLARDDAREDVFVQMLLSSEPDLRSDFQDKPLLFPVFGRGLLLYALAAEGINRWTLSKAVGFLTGSCSCQVKAANPGLDLLLAVDWNTLVVPMTAATAGGTAGSASFLKARDAAQESQEPQEPLPLSAPAVTRP